MESEYEQYPVEEVWLKNSFDLLHWMLVNFADDKKVNAYQSSYPDRAGRLADLMRDEDDMVEEDSDVSEEDYRMVESLTGIPRAQFKSLFKMDRAHPSKPSDA